MVQDITDKKTAIRSYIKNQRKLLEEKQKQKMDARLLGQLLNLPEFREKSSIPVYCYISVRNETDTLRFIERLWAQDMLVAVPRVEGKYIRFYRIEKKEDLIPGCMGIPEPSRMCIPIHCPEAPVITPGLAFTCEGARIGYGGGFYDRFFEAEPKHRRIALAYDFQMLPELPVGPLDKKVDVIVTENRVYHCSRGTAGRELED